MAARSYKVPILLPADPTALLEAATKQYVDTKVWNAAWGVIKVGSIVGTAGQNTIGANALADVFTMSSVTLVSGRRYRLSCQIRAAGPSSTPNNTAANFQLYMDNVAFSSPAGLDPWWSTPMQWGGPHAAWNFAVGDWGITAGAHTFKVAVQNRIGAAIGVYLDAASFFILEDMGPSGAGSYPAPPNTTGVMYPAEAGPRDDNAAIARFGHFDADGRLGHISASDGGNDIIYLNGKAFSVYRLDSGSYTLIAQFAGGLALYVNPKIWGASAAFDIAFRDNNARNFTLYAQGDQAFFYDSQVGNMGYFTKLANNLYKFYCGGVFIGVHPAHGTYSGIWVSPSGGEAAGNYFMITSDNGANVLVNAGSQMNFRIGNGSDIWYYNANQLRMNKQITVLYTPATGGWDYAPYVAVNGGDMQRISLNSVGVAPQLRSNNAYGDHLECVNLSSSGYCNIRAAAFPTASSIAIKKDVRPLRIRDLPPVNLDPRADLVTDLNIMALRPIAFRPKVPALHIVPTGDKPIDQADKSTFKTEERPLDQLRSHESRRERIGLIAEEVEKVIPSAVDHMEDGSMGAIDYAQITVALLDHVQRLTDEVSTLRYRIAELEKE